MTKFGFRPGNHADGRYVAIGIPAVEIDPFACQAGDQNFSVLGIDTDRVGSDQPGAWALNRANRWFVSIRAATKNQNGVGQGVGDDNFVVHCVVREAVNGPTELGALAGNDSLRASIPICQPGKCRDSRLAYSIGYQDLAAAGVVSEGHRIAETWSGSARWRAAQDAFWRDVAVGVAIES